MSSREGLYLGAFAGYFLAYASAGSSVDEVLRGLFIPLIVVFIGRAIQGGAK